jgi:hypothetical protein
MTEKELSAKRVERDIPKSFLSLCSPETTYVDKWSGDFL